MMNCQMVVGACGSQLTARYARALPVLVAGGFAESRQLVAGGKEGMEAAMASTCVHMLNILVCGTARLSGGTPG